MNQNARLALADLTKATADYETAYRAEHGRDRSLKSEENAIEMSRAFQAGRVAAATLADEIGRDAAKAINVALIFAAANVRHERSQDVTDSAATVRRAVKRPGDYV